jgi:protein SCO1/2
MAMVILAASASSARLRAEDSLPPLARDVGIVQRLNEEVPLDLTFRDEAGRIVPLSAYVKDKPVILVLAYYRCPMLCTQVLNGLLDSLRGISLDLGDAYRVVTVSFDARERPELAAAKKASYVENYGRAGAADGWHFLTAEQTSIDRLTRAVGFHYAYDRERDQFAHASGIMILTPEGKISRYFYGITFPSRDLRLALVEASAGKIGSLVDQVLLLCYHYNPSTGRYTPAIMGFVRLGGVLSFAILGLYLGRGWYRDWRNTQRTSDVR